ncbi:MAG: hypothetical protein LBP76_11320 [Treponema sp.]|nr:hypothetical protein [Treponema sp.]
MRGENILVMNDIEKQIAQQIIQSLSAGDIPAAGQNAEEDSTYWVNYKYHANKNEKILRGILLGCPYKLRYRSASRIFFSAWDCNDVCSVFYDMVAIIQGLTALKVNVSALYRPFEVDLHTDRYVFFTGQAAGSLVLITNYIVRNKYKISHGSQYIFTVFDGNNKSVYDALIERLQANGYSKIQIVQVWIRGEILYYALVDGAVMRPEYQRSLTSKEEEDIIRKIHKTAGNKLHHVEMKMST